MHTTVENLGIDKLTVTERLALIDQIWDTIPEGEHPPVDPPPEWHTRLLEKRLADAEANPGSGRPWREVLDDLAKSP